MKALLCLLLLAPLAASGPPKVQDEVHPRAPGTPLEIVFTPYYCELCATEGRIEKLEHVSTMLRMETSFPKDLDGNQRLNHWKKYELLVEDDPEYLQEILLL